MTFIKCYIHSRINRSINYRYRRTDWNLPILDEDPECCKSDFAGFTECWFLVTLSSESLGVSFSTFKVDNSSSISITKVLLQVGHFNWFVPEIFKFIHTIKFIIPRFYKLRFVINKISLIYVVFKKCTWCRWTY